MPTAISRFETTEGSSYLQRLCKYFAHKVEVTYDAHRGEIRLPVALVVMEASPEGLSLVVRSEDEGLNRGKSVIESHLLRFAFCETLEKLEWARAAS